MRIFGPLLLTFMVVLNFIDLSSSQGKPRTKDKVLSSSNQNDVPILPSSSSENPGRQHLDPSESDLSSSRDEHSTNIHLHSSNLKFVPIRPRPSSSTNSGPQHPILSESGARSRRRNPPKMKKAKLIHSANSNLVPILPKPPVPQTPYRYPGSQYPGSNYHFAGQFHSGPDVNLNNNHPPAENESEVSRSISRPPNNSHEGESSGSGYITEKWWDQKWNH